MYSPIEITMLLHFLSKKITMLNGYSLRNRPFETYDMQFKVIMSLVKFKFIKHKKANAQPHLYQPSNFLP